MISDSNYQSIVIHRIIIIVITHIHDTGVVNSVSPRASCNQRGIRISCINARIHYSRLARILLEMEIVVVGVVKEGVSVDVAGP